MVRLDDAAPAAVPLPARSIAAVLAAALVATEQQHRYEELVALERPEQTSRLLAGTRLGAEAQDLLRAIMSVDLTNTKDYELDSPLLETDR